LKDDSIVKFKIGDDWIEYEKGVFTVVCDYKDVYAGKFFELAQQAFKENTRWGCTLTNKKS